MSDNISNICLSNTRIKKLSPLLINQLAAGEVVTRPAAVVKELLENAIDAHATHIEVRITQGGMGMIEVVDNGVGIHPDDMVMAITRHATSKVADIANLHGISTLGFRGEALAATAAVSRLTLISSHDDSGIGRQLQVTGVLAEVPKLLPIVHRRGTTIIIKDLYFNVPARRGNLKSIATEFAHIETIVREVALAYADVTLSLFHDHKKRLSLSANDVSNNLDVNSSAISSTSSRLPLARLEQALGIALIDNALQVSVDLTPIMQQTSEHTQQYLATQNAATQDATQSNISSAAISGWLWPISCVQSTNTSLPKLLYINGRLVKEPLISNQLRQLAQSAQLNNIGYALYFELPLHWLNVNVHPAKQRIKISSLNNIMAHLSHAITLKLKSVIEQNVYTESPLAQQGQQPNKQVKEKVHSYQHVIEASPSATTMNIKVNSLSSNNKPTYKDSSVLTDIAVSNTINRLSLPQCLDIIDNLDYQIELAEENLLTKNSLSISPWLLFYVDDRFIIVSQKQWQSSLALIFSSHSSSMTPILTDAASVNQQLARYTTQMSEPDRLAFIADIEQILTLQALKYLDSSQLVALMLSSPSL